MKGPWDNDPETPWDNDPTVEPVKPLAGGRAPREVREQEYTREDRKAAYGEMARGIRERQSAPVRYLDTAARGLARAVPFMNEASAGLNYLTGRGGDSYEDSLDRERAMSDVDDTDRTALSVGSQVAGMLAMPGAGWANSGNMAGRIVKGGVLGGGYGALYGAGDGDTLGQRAGNAVEGAKTGAIFGAAGTGAFEALRAGAGAVGALSAPIRGYRRPVAEAERRIAAGLGQDRAVGGRMLDDAAYAEAAAAGQNPMLIDRGGATIRAMARDARNTSPEAAQQLEGALAGRADVQNDAAGDFFSRLFSPLRSPNPEATIERLQRRAQAANSANYRRAEEAAENLISPGGRVNPAFPDGLMTPVLDRLAQSPLVQQAMQKSLSTGMNDATLRGFRVTPPTNPFVRTDQGFVLRQAGPNGERVLPTLAYWDQVQRNLRSVAQKAKIAGDDNLARQANGMRSQLISHLDEILPEYQTARQGAARFFGAEDALEAGENFFSMSKRGDIAKARQAIGRMNASERGLFAEGYLAAAEAAARKTGDGRSASGMKMWNSPEARTKLELAIGPRRAREAMAYRDRAEILEWSNKAVFGGSNTTMQLAALGLAGGATGAYMTGDLTGGFGGAMVAPLVKLGMKGIKGRVDDRVSRELARLLTSTNPATHQRIINSSRNQQQLTEALNHIASSLPKLSAPVADEVNDRRREPIEIEVKKYADGGMVDSMAGFLPPEAAAPMREEMGPPMAPPVPMTAETLPELDPFAGEKALASGAMDAAGTAGRYLRDTPLSQMPGDVAKMGGAMWEGAKADPMGFALDMMPIVGEARSGMESRDLLVKAEEAEAAGDTDMASKLRQLASVAAAGAIPAAGIGARMGKQAAKSAIMGAAGEAVAHPGRISTRLPNAVKSVDDPYTGRLQIDIPAMRADPEGWEHNVGLLRDYPNIPEALAKGAPDDVAKAFEDHAVDNLLWLYDQVPQEVRDQSKRWYDGARKLTDQWVEKYQVPDTAIAATLAALSPQKDWFMNVSLAERVLDIYSTKQDFRFSNQMFPTAEAIFGDPKYQPILDLVKNKTFGELSTPAEKAMWLRIYDETYNDRGHRLVTPEGDFGDFVKTAKGENSGTGWGSLKEISKAIAALDAKGDHRAITELMGERHKVRSFYNNILDPNGPDGDVTIDTHAVAAALLRPLSGNSLEVAQNFKNSLDKKFQNKIRATGREPVGASGSKITGAQGLYGLYADAYRRAAAERGVLPREMQSITWEAVRGLFPDTFKTAKNNAAIDGVWYAYRKGEIDLGTARQQILKLAGGVTPPSWFGSGGGPSGTGATSSYAGELSGGRLSGQAAGGMDGGAGGGTPGAPSGLEPVPKKKGGPVKKRRTLASSDADLHEYLMATVAPPMAQRFAMGGPVFPAAVNNRIGALSRRH